MARTSLRRKQISVWQDAHTLLTNLLFLFRRQTALNVVLLLIFVFIAGALYFIFRREARVITARFRILNDQRQGFLANEYATHFLELIQGDVEKNDLGQPIAEVIRISAFKTDPNASVIFVDVKMSAKHNPHKDTYYLRGKQLAYNEVFDFNFSRVQFRGSLVELFPEQREPEYRTRLIRAQLRNTYEGVPDTHGVESYMAVAVTQGNKVVDRNGTMLAEVMAVSIEPAERVTTTAGGQLVVTTDPLLKDVYYTLQIQTQVIDGNEYAFGYFPLQVGIGIPLNFASVTVWPTITEIIE